LNQLGGHAWIEISRKSVESMKLCENFFESFGISCDLYFACIEISRKSVGSMDLLFLETS
jgi:hypothetical protein